MTTDECIGLAIFTVMLIWFSFNSGRYAENQRREKAKEKALRKQTVYRRELTARFIKTYEETFKNAIQFNYDSKSTGGIFLTDRARKEIGFSDKTASCDIFASLMRSYKKTLGNE